MAPRGVALVDPRHEALVAPLKPQRQGNWLVYRKPADAARDTWSHYLHGPDNNAVSSDALVGSPRSIQWITGPTYGRHHNRLASLSASQLGTVAIEAALDRANIAADEVNDVIMGQVLTAGTGQNPARQAAINAGIPASSTAITINQVCGSGLRPVAMAYQSILAGDASIAVAGGQESSLGSNGAGEERPMDGGCQ